MEEFGGFLSSYDRSQRLERRKECQGEGTILDN